MKVSLQPLKTRANYQFRLHIYYLTTDYTNKVLKYKMYDYFNDLIANLS